MTEFKGKGCIVDVTTGLVFGSVQEFRLQPKSELVFPVGDRWRSHVVLAGISFLGEIAFKVLDMETFRAVAGSEPLRDIVQTPEDVPDKFSFYGVLRRSGNRLAVYLADCRQTGDFRFGAPVGGVGSFTISFVAQNNQAGDVVFYLPPWDPRGNKPEIQKGHDVAEDRELVNLSPISIKINELSPEYRAETEQAGEGR